MPTHAERQIVPYRPDQVFDLVADVGKYPQFLPHPQGCEVDFFVDFEFRSRILQATIGVVFNEAVRRMVGAFNKRARQVYGPPVATDTAPDAVKS